MPPLKYCSIILHRVLFTLLIFALVSSKWIKEEQRTDYLEDAGPEEDMFDDVVPMELDDVISCHHGTSKTDVHPAQVCSTGNACYKFEFIELKNDKATTNETILEWGCTEKDMCRDILLSLDTCTPNTKLWTSDSSITKQGTHCCCSQAMCNAYNRHTLNANQKYKPTSNASAYYSNVFAFTLSILINLI